MAFSTVHLFRVNLMPASDGAEQLKAGELEEAKKLIAVQKVEC